MKYASKLPKEDKAFSEKLIKEGWQRLKEPDNLATATIYSLPFAFILSIIVGFIAYFIKPDLFNFISNENFKLEFYLDYRIIFLVGALYIYMFIHEMIHAVFIPKFRSSDKTFWGLNGMFGFVFTSEEIPRNRYLLISVMPFFILSIVAMFVFYALNVLNWFTLTLCILNAAGSCVDFLGVTLVLAQVKKNQVLLNNGIKTFYR